MLHSILHCRIDLRVSQNLLYLLDRHSFVNCSGRHRPAEFMWMNLLQMQLPAKLTDADFNTADMKPLVWCILRSNDLTESIQARLSPTVRKFFCFCEEKGSPIEHITDKDFLDFISESAKDTPGSMSIVMRALRIIAEYVRSNGIADLKFDLSLFRPQTVSRQIIPGYSQEEIATILSVINEGTSKTPKRDRAMILLSFNAGFRGVDIRTVLLSDMDWKTGEIRIVQHKTGKPLSASLNGMTLNAIADYILNERPRSNYAKMSSDNVRVFVEQYGAEARKILPSIPHIKPHLFRHTRAMHLYMAGMPLELISQWLGHSQMETTLIYASATAEMKRKEVEKIYKKENSVFKEDEKFKYENDDEIIKRLYGLM